MVRGYSCARRRDRVHKRSFYLDAGIPEYWMVDGEDRTIRVARVGREDSITRDVLVWHPSGTAFPLTVRVDDVFG